MKRKREIWSKPWGYKEGVLISLALLLVGLIIEYTSGGKGTIALTTYPNNLIIAGIVLISTIFLGFFGKKLQFTIWLQSVPAAICSISLLLFVTLMMGITPQNDSSVPLRIYLLGLSHVLNSWIYLLASLFLIMSLGLTIIKNLIHFEVRKVGFIISHVGLWIVLFGANFGSIQVSRNIIELREGQVSNESVDPLTGKVEKLPFAIRLNDFIMEEYNPKLTLVNNQTGNIAESINNKTMLADSGVREEIGDWEIVILEYIYSSAKAGKKYHFVNEIGAAPSARVLAINKTNDSIEGWVSCGSFNRYYEALKLNHKYSIVMLFPEPKEYTSELTILRNSSDSKDISLEVNKPYSVDGWKIYQMSYNSDLGRWSDTSVIEVIRDPWLWFVYIGIFMMLAGALYMFWMGSNISSPVTKNTRKHA